MSLQLSETLRQEYQGLFDTCQIHADRLTEIDETIAKIVASRDRYEAVSVPLGVPWYVTAVIHYRECDLDFTQHLYNGDSLKKKTIHVPKGLPPGNPPFTWEYSAGCALEYDGFDSWVDWSIPGTFYMLEKYNGVGYRNLKPPIHTPYLWSFSNQYSSGKFTSDHGFDPAAIDEQCGAAVLLRRMVNRDIVHIDHPLRSVKVEINGTATDIGALLIASHTWVAPRTLSGVLDAEITNAGGKPFTITLKAGAHQKTFAAQVIDGVGYVLFSDFISLFSYNFTFNAQTLILNVTVPLPG